MYLGDGEAFCEKAPFLNAQMPRKISLFVVGGARQTDALFAPFVIEVLVLSLYAPN